MDISGEDIVASLSRQVGEKSREAAVSEARAIAAEKMNVQLHQVIETLQTKLAEYATPEEGDDA